MKNKVLSLLLALTFLAQFHTQVSAVGPEDEFPKAIQSSWGMPVMVACGVVAVASIGYVGYRAYDYHCFKNKTIKIEGSSWSADDPGSRINPRSDLDVQRYIQNLIRTEIPKLRTSDTFEARHLANINLSIMSINVDLERRINIEESRRLASHLKNEDEYLTRIMDKQKSIKVGDLIEELQKIDSLARQATVIIDQHLYKNK